MSFKVNLAAWTKSQRIADAMGLTVRIDVDKEDIDTFVVSEGVVELRRVGSLVGLSHYLAGFEEGQKFVRSATKKPVARKHIEKEGSAA